MFFYRGPVVLVCALAIGFATGCRQGDTMTKTESPPAYFGKTISLEQLADRLGLKIVREASTHVMLKKAGNRVFIFMDPNGRAYVNGRQVGPKGGVFRKDGVVQIPGVIEQAIRDSLCAVTSAPPKPTRVKSGRGRSVVIDPGHGGKDQGATSILGYHEKAVNLAVAVELAHLLLLEGFTVKMTRDRDVFIALNDRAGFANTTGADLFISLHADAAPNRSARGFTVYICRSASTGARSAAAALHRTLQSTGLNDRGMREANFLVLVQTRCPAVLVEMGYLSNRHDASLLAERKFLGRIARALADGIADYFQIERTAFLRFRPRPKPAGRPDPVGDGVVLTGLTV